MIVSQRLKTDQAGAIMLLGVFMAVFLTAALYYVVGIGDAIAQRERMQDAADAAAFSAAVVHARGMNVLALINMVMAALLAVLIALKLVETLTTVALVAVSVMSFLEPGLAAMIPELAALRQEVREAASAWQTEMNVALQTLHAASVGVRAAVPLASELPVITAIKADYGPPVTFAVVVPTRVTLPAQDGSFAELCERANEYLLDFTSFALGQVAPGPVAEIVAGAMDGLTSAGADWFCGEGGSSPPKTKVTQDAHHPALPSRKQCLEYAPSQQGYDEVEHGKRCDQAEQDEQDSEPDEITGKCRRRCAPEEPFEQRDPLAREQCAPRKGRDRLRDFDWQERHFRRRYVFHAGAWRVASDKDEEEKSARYERHRADRRPCGEPRSAVSPDWNPTLRAADSRELLPVCSDAITPTVAGRELQSATVEQVEVLRFFGCSERIEHEYDLAKYAHDRITAKEHDSGLKRVPQVLEDGAVNGSEDFQLRAVVMGELPRDVSETILRVATWKSDSSAPGAPTERSISSAARGFGRVSLAQAEYFFDVPDRNSQNPKDFMWSMRWKARLRRFRLPEARSNSTASLGRSFADACRAAEARAATANDTGESPCSADFSIADLFVH